ncbi:uncharacterized protein LDX57_003643 [Aspergillus melleus]|uniref:uncharacterized protein n=1 Tax=Aspergillus melleus TaxID=138277 RepID=UPI001E8EDDB6|nr:uncharacterized protein LDX57_003643 [Aspergillus melleus]KAH8425902.1 hypothetical protein LDX57_003643 [Aspergillus melleus]
MTERSPPPELPLPKDLPVRILVQTKTQLVPKDQDQGNDVYSDKLVSMLNRISRYHWNCAYWPFENRFYTQGDEFGYNNRLCFLMVDHGTTSNDDEVLVLCYEWTGEDFKYTPDLLASKEVQDELKEIPFTPGPYVPREKPPIRRVVRRRLREAQRIPDEELEYMQQHPEDMEWLERKVKPRFWANFLAQIEARPREKEEEERLGVTSGPLPDDVRLEFD